MELVIAAADSWPSLMEKRPLYRGFKAIQQNALSSVSVCVSIFTLPLSPTCSQSSLSTRSAGLLPACAPGKWAKESKHYIDRKNIVYTVWQIQRTKTIPMTICVTFTMLCMKESPHKHNPNWPCPLPYVTWEPFFIPQLFISSLPVISHYSSLSGWTESLHQPPSDSNICHLSLPLLTIYSVHL